MYEPGILEKAAEAIAGADALLITAGAGMGVDSGLPDFRGNQGFWRAYPPYERLGLSFVELANPDHFSKDPTLAWGFYGHRLELYRRTEPHEGYRILQKWSQQKSEGAFVFTSNVDGHFQRAGFDPDRVVEVHGSIHWMQCLAGCGQDIYPADEVSLAIDEQNMRASAPLPQCPGCGEMARPNILMFGDWGWLDRRTREQGKRFDSWLRSLNDAKLAIVECGAGTAIPTVRRLGEGLVQGWDATLIRINVREPQAPDGQIGIALGALDALRELDSLVESCS